MPSCFYGGQNPILLPCNSWAVAWMPEAGTACRIGFVNNLSGKSVYDMMALHMERLACQPSPKGFEGVTSFLTTGFLSDIRLRIEEILTELELGRSCMRGLLSSVRKK